MSLSNVQPPIHYEVVGLVETVRSLLKMKGHDVWSIRPDATVYEAIALMAEKSIGALIVLDRESIAGIISERDYARNVILKGHSSKEIKVQEIMTRSVVTVTSDHTVADCMYIMTHRRVRHLPVVDGGELKGVVSIGDIVRATISAQADTIRHLSSYIKGDYPV
jgi:CBS domain-containing protein